MAHEEEHKNRRGQGLRDEYLDVVDGNDQVIGKQLRAVLYKERASNFRVVNGFIRNSNGQLWIPRRSAHTDLFPNALDFSVGGHVVSGESYNHAFQREAREELRKIVTEADYRVLGRLTPSRDGVSSFMQVYEIASGETPDYNTKDFTDSYWLRPDELRAMIQCGEPAKSDLVIVLNRFYIGASLT